MRNRWVSITLSYGAIKIDNNLTITDIIIDTEYVVKTYPTNVNELMKHWIGEKIEVDEND